jgi:hypothetical protein
MLHRADDVEQVDAVEQRLVVERDRPPEHLVGHSQLVHHGRVVATGDVRAAEDRQALGGGSIGALGLLEPGWARVVAGAERGALVDHVQVVRCIAVHRQRRQHDDVRRAGCRHHRLGGVHQDLPVGALPLLDRHGLCRGRACGDHDRIHAGRSGVHLLGVRAGEYDHLVAHLLQAGHLRRRRGGADHLVAVGAELSRQLRADQAAADDERAHEGLPGLARRCGYSQHT